jgi:tripartite-type tricarboxylate transporter receptor subunit TctC
MLNTILATALALAFTGTAQAQEWPTRPITMVIPFAAGGPTDVLGRLVAGRMSEILGQQVVVENVTGDGGVIGSTRVKNAPPDGYQFVLGTVGTHAHNQTLYKKPAYDAVADFTPVALLAEVPLVLITRKDFPAGNLQEFIAYAKANQTKLTYGSAGPASATHLGCVLLNSAIGANLRHIPYRGTGPAMQDLVAGRIDFLCDAVTTALPQIQEGSVKALAAMNKSRLPVLPDLPTADEQGLKDFVAYTWNAAFLPKGVPEPVVNKLRDAMAEAIKAPAVRDRLQGLGALLATEDRSTSEYLGKFVKSEIEKWAAPIKASGVSVD